MKTKTTLIQELIAAKNAGVNFVTYGDGDLGMPVEIDDAIEDIKSMDEDMIGDGTWYACDENGEV
jgi:hypothetical protein